MSIHLPLDPNFEDFNFSAIADPALEPGKGPDKSWLYGLVYLARKGKHSGALEFSDAMYWTLKEGAFDAFKWKHGPRPITYLDWFHAKLVQFFEILLYEELLVGHMHPPKTNRPWKEGALTGSGPIIDEEQLQKAFSPRDVDEFDWYPMVLQISAAGKKRLELFQRLLRERIVKMAGPAEDTNQADRTHVPLTSPPRLRASRNDRRNMLIVSCRRRGMAPADICKLLDQKGFSTTKVMQEHGLARWTDAWDDPEFRNNVEQLISKALRRFPDVKS